MKTIKPTHSLAYAQGFEAGLWLSHYWAVSYGIPIETATQYARSTAYRKGHLPVSDFLAGYNQGIKQGLKQKGFIVTYEQWAIQNDEEVAAIRGINDEYEDIWEIAHQCLLGAFYDARLDPEGFYDVKALEKFVEIFEGCNDYKQAPYENLEDVCGEIFGLAFRTDKARLTHMHFWYCMCTYLRRAYALELKREDPEAAHDQGLALELHNDILDTVERFIKKHSPSDIEAAIDYLQEDVGYGDIAQHLLSEAIVDMEAGS